VLDLDHVAHLLMVDLSYQMKPSTHIEGLAVGDSGMAPRQDIEASAFTDHKGDVLPGSGQRPNLTEGRDLMFVVGFRIVQNFRNLDCGLCRRRTSGSQYDQCNQGRGNFQAQS